MRRKPEFDRFTSGLSQRVNGWLDDPDYTPQDLTNIVRSELSRIWKYLIDKINQNEHKIKDLEQQLYQSNKERAEFERKLVEAEKLKDFSFKKRVELEGLLAIAVEALEWAKSNVGYASPWWIKIDEALAKINQK